jgi:hypothetical protein
MCPQTPSLSPEYSHKAGLQTVITSMSLQVRPVIQKRPRGARYNGPDHTWALGLNEAAPREDVAAGLRQRAGSSEGCPCPFCLCPTSDCSEGLERRVASLPSPQHYANVIWLKSSLCPTHANKYVTWLTLNSLTYKIIWYSIFFICPTHASTVGEASIQITVHNWPEWLKKTLYKLKYLVCIDGGYRVNFYTCSKDRRCQSSPSDPHLARIRYGQGSCAMIHGVELGHIDASSTKWVQRARYIAHHRLWRRAVLHRHHEIRDDNGYPKPETRWVFTPLGYRFGLIFIPMSLLMGINLYPTGL